jgi:hypothetical protein
MMVDHVEFDECDPNGPLCAKCIARLGRVRRGVTDMIIGPILGETVTWYPPGGPVEREPLVGNPEPSPVMYGFAVDGAGPDNNNVTWQVDECVEDLEAHAVNLHGTIGYDREFTTWARAFVEGWYAAGVNIGGEDLGKLDDFSWKVKDAVREKLKERG